jgi:hypothetical protein
LSADVVSGIASAPGCAQTEELNPTATRHTKTVERKLMDNVLSLLNKQ